MRKRNLTALLLAAVALVLALQFCTYAHNWGDDFAAYILEAKAIMNGTVEEQGRQNVALHPSKFFSQDIREMSELYYVWGLPMMLLPVLKLLPEGTDLLQEIFWLKLPGCLCLALLAACAYLFYARRMSSRLSIVLTAMLVVGVADECSFIHTDLPELTFTMAGFLLFELCTEEKRGWLRQILLGLTLYLAWAIRLNGFTVALYIGMLCVAGCLKNRRMEWKWLISFGVFGALCLVQTAFLPLPTSNLKDVGQGSNIFTGLLYTAIDVGGWAWMLMYFRSTWVHILSSACLAVFGGIALFRFGFVRERRYTIFMLGTYFVTALLPYGQGARYFMSIVPFIVLFIGMGMQYVLQQLERLWKKRGKTGGFRQISPQLFRRMAAGVLLILIANCCMARWEKTWGAVDDPVRNGFTPAAMEVYGYIQENTEPEDRVAFWRPRLMAYTTGRQGFNPGLDIYNILDADYFLQMKLEEYRIGLSEEQESLLEPVFENEEFVLYRVMEEPLQ